jgi:hypothetical protein
MENKEVISTDTKTKKHSQDVQEGEIRNLENDSIDKESEWNRHEYLKHMG